MANVQPQETQKFHLHEPSRENAGISGFVLAGGRSSRLHRDKVLLPWKEATLLDHAIQRLRQVGDSVCICANRDDLAGFGLPILHDAAPHAGPLGGIVAALEQSQTPWNLFLAVDLPLLPVHLLQTLARRAASEPAGTLCIVPQVDGLPQPLCGMYHRSLCDGLRQALNGGKYKIMHAVREATAAIPGSRVELFEVLSETSIDEVRDWFLNVNTPEDWERARQLAPLRGFSEAD